MEEVDKECFVFLYELEHFNHRGVDFDDQETNEKLWAELFELLLNPVK